MAVQPDIALGFNPTTPSLGSDLNALIPLVQQAQEKKKQNALRQILAAPGAIDPATGLPSSQAIQQVTKIDPQTGMKLATESATLHSDIQKGNAAEMEEYKPIIQQQKDALANILKEDVEKYGPAKAAEMHRGDYTASRQALLDSGVPKAIVDRMPGELTPALAQNFVAGAISPEKKSELAEKEKADVRADKTFGLAERKESETERKDDALIASLDAKTKASGTQSFTPEMGSLMAALAEKGVSLPTGLRSKAQQIELYQGLIDRNPGKAPDEIADLVKKGQIELGAQKKETTTAAGVAGKVEVAQNELKQFIPLVEGASAKVPRGAWVPLSKLVQMADSSISDPNLKQLKIYVNSTLNAYDQLASRGGTDKDKRAAAHELLLSADGPEAMKAALDAFGKEAEAARIAAVTATKVPELADTDKAKSDAPKKGHAIGDMIVQGGKRYKATAVDKDGNVTAADEVK